MDEIRAAFHKEYPDAAKYFHSASGNYTWMRFNDMFDAWTRATLAAMPVADIRSSLGHVGMQWVNFAQRAMLREPEDTERKAKMRAVAEGFRLPATLVVVGVATGSGHD